MVPVDLRSDTVTRPTAAMRAAIAAAEVGDDVFGDDPTVNLLQQRAAELLGKSAALFVPSGTMANQIAIRASTRPGDELIIDRFSHAYLYEGGAAAALSGVSVYPLDKPRGIFSAADVLAAIRPDDPHFARSRLVIIENTNNNGGGSIWPLESVADIRAVADQHGLRVHLDGARLLNACVASGCEPSEYARYADSVSICFSKGLGAPIGSVIAGDEEFIAHALRVRKRLGGGMRQAGLLAAAALYALDHNVERLVEDHINARKLAEALAELPGIIIDPDAVQTNLVYFDVDQRHQTADELAARLHERGVWLLALGPRTARAVTHLDVSSEQIDHAIGVLREVCREA